MKITKQLRGYCERIELEIEKVEDCGKFSIYQVYKIVNGVKVPLYRECYSDFDIASLKSKGCVFSVD